MIHNSLDICFATTSFNVFVGSSPILSPDETLFICAEDGSSVTLTADPGFSEYEWSTSETTPSITVNQPGIYTVIVKNGRIVFYKESKIVNLEVLCYIHSINSSKPTTIQKRILLCTCSST